MTRVKERYNAAAGEVVGDIWVTETGCGSNEPLGEWGQGLALGQLMDWFTSRVRCKAVHVHRYYTWPEADGGLWPTYPVLRNDYTKKAPAQFFLSLNWAGAP